MTEAFSIGIAGLGTVGVGVVKILQTHADMIAERAGRPIKIVSVTAGNKNKDRGVDISGYDWADSLDNMAQDTRLDAVIEMIGGSEGPVKGMIENALSTGKHVVTANKALLAHHGVALAKLAEENNVTIAYEAAIAGGIPVVKTLREGLSANKVQNIYGILNGTCNYILSDMRETGRDFEVVLKEAQDLGYAEADPSFDVDGIDAAHKLALLGALAFGVEPDFKGLNIEGIRAVGFDDIKYATELGYRIKLLGMASHNDQGYMQTMEPCLVPINSALGSVESVFNAVMMDGDYVDKVMMEGRGAGEGPTASSVVADIIDLAKGNGLPVFSVATNKLKSVDWQSFEDVESCFYLHLKVKDEKGVLAGITACLDKENISVDNFIQRGHDSNGTASIIIETHATNAIAINSAIVDIEALGNVQGKAISMRIEKL